METLTEYMKNNRPESSFKAEPFYSSDGDSLTYSFRNEPSYRERIDDFLTVYRSRKDDGLVGCQIKGLPKALNLLGTFGLLISDGKLTMGMIFIACMAETNELEARECYKELGEKLSNTEIPREQFERLMA